MKQQIVLMYLRYEDIWDCCDIHLVPVHVVDRFIFQVKLKSGTNLYGMVVERDVSERLAKSGVADIPTGWLIRADVAYNLTLKSRINYNNRGLLMKENRDTVYSAVRRVIAKNEHEIYTGNLSVRLRRKD